MPPSRLRREKDDSIVRGWESWKDTKGPKVGREARGKKRDIEKKRNTEAQQADQWQTLAKWRGGQSGHVESREAGSGARRSPSLLRLFLFGRWASFGGEIVLSGDTVFPPRRSLARMPV